MIITILFLEMMFKSTVHVKELVLKMNKCIKNTRDNRVKLFSPQEFLIGIGLLIGACEFDHQGINCLKEGYHNNDFDGTVEENEYEFDSLASLPNFDKYMTFNRFKDFRMMMISPRKE